MTAFQTIAILLTGAALAGFINHRFLKLPTTIGLMVFALLLSSVGIGLNHMGLINLGDTAQFVHKIDFSNVLLHGMLSLLLFAGALHIDLDELRGVGVAVAILATAGVLLATGVTGGLLWLAAAQLGAPLTLIDAMLFGALIAPTDPVAVLAIMKQSKVPQRLYAKIGGESLFNDGVGVVIFITILGIAANGQQPVQIHIISAHLLREVAGGALLGVALGWLTFRLIRSIDEYKVEVLLSLALATGGYALAEALGFSAPITMAAAGLIIGHHGRAFGMSATSRLHLDLFWELLDEILNAVLFILIGLELMIIPFSLPLILMGGLAIAVVLAARFISVGLPIGLLRLFAPVAPGTVRLLTWGGLRGGISIAMALSVPDNYDKDLILAMTYIVVIFSILIQGLTMPRMVASILDPAGANSRHQG